MKVSKNFSLKELVSKGVYEKFNDRSIIFLDKNTIELLQDIRDHFGNPITVNNWHKHGNFNYRGFRELECTIGAQYSQHRYGRAFDFHIDGMSAEEIRQELIKKRDDLFPSLSCMELDVTWVHFDTRMTKDGNLVLFKP